MPSCESRGVNTMIMTTYVNFNGACAEAFRYYREHLGGTIDSITTFGEMPEHSRVPEAWSDRVIHARMSVGGAVLMGADIEGAEPMRSAYLTLSTATPEEAQRAYAALSDGGQVFMPLQETFFAVRHAQLRDRFGINWMILNERTSPPAADSAP